MLQIVYVSFLIILLKYQCISPQMFGDKNNHLVSNIKINQEIKKLLKICLISTFKDKEMITTFKHFKNNMFR